jgi:hypothetical protein
MVFQRHEVSMRPWQYLYRLVQQAAPLASNKGYFVWLKVWTGYSDHHKLSGEAKKQKKKQSSPATRHGGAWGRGDKTPTHSWSGSRWGCAVSVTPRSRFAPGNDPPPRITIVRGAGWAAKPIWTPRLQEKHVAPAGERTPIARSLLTELLRFLSGEVRTFYFLLVETLMLHILVHMLIWTWSI